MDEKDSVTAQRILGRVSSPTFYVYLSASRPAASFPDAIRASLAFHYHLSFLLCLLTVSFRLFVSMSSGNVYIISYCPPCSFSDHSRRLLVAVTAPVSLYPLLPFIWPSHTAQLVLVPLQWVQAPDPGLRAAASLPPFYRERAGLPEGKMLCTGAHLTQLSCFFRLKSTGYSYLTTIIPYLTFLFFSENR